MGIRQSHRPPIADDFMAVSALVGLVVARWNAEWDQAASEPATNKTEYQAEDPGKCSFLLVKVSHAGMSAVLARDGARMVRPVRHCVRTGVVMIYNQDLLARLHYHWLLLAHLRLLHRLGVWLGHRGLARHLLAWGCHDRLGVGLLGVGLLDVGLLGCVLWSHLLRCVCGLLLDKRLLLGRYFRRVSVFGHFMVSNYFYYF